MCIRDRVVFAQTEDALIAIGRAHDNAIALNARHFAVHVGCLLYTSDAADERSSVDLGGRRIIKKKKEAISTSERMRSTEA